jgi:hypothetical protein
MNATTARWIRGGALAVLFVSSIAVAEVYESLRGTIESVDGQTLVVETRSGSTTNIKLVDGAHIFTLNPSSIGDVKVGSFVGIVTKPQADNTENVVQIYVFPSDPAGDPFDIPTTGLITPGNAAEVLNYIEGLISKNDGEALTVKHDGGDDTVAVSANTKIVTVTPATPAAIEAGQKFFIPNGHPSVLRRGSANHHSGGIALDHVAGLLFKPCRPLRVTERFKVSGRPAVWAGTRIEIAR